jgi:hypothetical protein
MFFRDKASRLGLVRVYSNPEYTYGFIKEMIKTLLYRSEKLF